MPTAIVTPDLDAIVSEIDIAAPPECVFRALTDAAQQMQWWNNDVCKVSVFEMDARVGGKWRFESADPTGKVEVNGVREFKAHGEIVELNPPRILRIPGSPTGTISRSAAVSYAGSSRAPAPAHT